MHITNTYVYLTVARAPERPPAALPRGSSLRSGFSTFWTVSKPVWSESMSDRRRKGHLERVTLCEIATLQSLLPAREPLVSRHASLRLASHS